MPNIGQGPLAQSVELCTYVVNEMQGSRVRFSEGPLFLSSLLHTRGHFPVPVLNHETMRKSLAVENLHTFNPMV